MLMGNIRALYVYRGIAKKRCGNLAYTENALLSLEKGKKGVKNLTIVTAGLDLPG
jgi:hypothetical protein